MIVTIIMIIVIRIILKQYKSNNRNNGMKQWNILEINVIIVGTIIFIITTILIFLLIV